MASINCENTRRSQGKTERKAWIHLLRCEVTLSVLLRIPSGRASRASIGLTLVTRVVLRVGSVGLLGSTPISLIASLARIASIGVAEPSIGALVRSRLWLTLARCLTFGPKVWCWAWNVFRRIVSVELLVNGWWNCCNLSAKLLLDFVEVEAIIPIDQVDRDSQMPETPRSPNAVEVGLCILWEIEIDDHVDSLNVNTTGKKIRANEIAAYTVPEIVEHTVTVMLQHLRVRVEAGVAKFGDLFRKQLHSVCGVAKNDGLVDLEFGEESIETVDFLLLFYEAVVLRYTSKSELVHQVDFVRISHMFILE